MRLKVISNSPLPPITAEANTAEIDQLPVGTRVVLRQGNKEAFIAVSSEGFHIEVGDVIKDQSPLSVVPNDAG